MHRNLAITFIVIIIGTTIYLYLNYKQESILDTQSIKETPQVVENIIATTTREVKEDQVSPSVAYLFESKPRDPMYSNVIGYFAGGAFAWYVPDWLVENWTIESVEDNPNDGGMVITPKVPVINSPISDIVINVGTSTEYFNAATLFDKEKSGNVIISEVLLNKHTEGGMTIIIETTTRIYHVQKEIDGTVHDLYFMDGNGKTAEISFSADKDNFPIYATKIRDLVEGIGEIKAPQG